MEFGTLSLVRGREWTQRVERGGRGGRGGGGGKEGRRKADLRLLRLIHGQNCVGRGPRTRGDTRQHCRNFAICIFTHDFFFVRPKVTFGP